MGHNLKISGGLPAFVFGILICALPIAVLVLVPQFVPYHRTVQAQIFGVLGLLVLAGVAVGFFLGFRAYYFIMTLALPILPYFTSYLSPIGGMVLVAVPESGLALLCALLLANLFFAKGIKHSPINFFIMMWILFNSLSLAFSDDFSMSLPLFLVGVLFSGLYLFLLHNVILNSSSGLKFGLITFISANALFIIFGLLLTGVYTNWDFVVDIFASRLGQDVNTGGYGSNAFGGVLLLFLPVIFWALAVKPQFCNIPKSISLMLFFISVMIILLSISRGNVVALAFLLCVILLYLVRTSYRGRSFIPLAILIFIQLWVIYRTDYIEIFLVRLVDERQLSLANLVLNSLHNVRAVLAEISWAIFLENWAFGVGQGNVQAEIFLRSGINYDAHNLMFNVLAEQGVFVFLLLISLFVYVTYLTWVAIRKKDYGDRWLAFFCYAGLIAYLIRCNTTGGTIAGNQFIGAHKMCWLFTLVAIIYQLAKTPREVTEVPSPGQSEIKEATSETPLLQS